MHMEKLSKSGTDEKLEKTLEITQFRGQELEKTLEIPTFGTGGTGETCKKFLRSRNQEVKVEKHTRFLQFLHSKSRRAGFLQGIKN